MRLVNGIVDFGSGVISGYPEQDPFKDDFEKIKKSADDWDQLLDFNFDDIPQLDGEELSPFVCKMGKKEVRPVFETLAYNDKYKKVLDKIWKDKVELDGMIVEEEEKAIIKVKGKALKEKDDPRAFIFLIRFEGKINENALADIGSDIKTMPYRIYEKLGREEIKKVDRGITMINHTQVEPIGILTNVLCQLVGICHQIFGAARSDVLRTTESDSDDEEEYEIKRNKFGAPILESTSVLGKNRRTLPISQEDETMMKPDHQNPNALANMKPWKKCCFHKFIMNSYYGKAATKRRSLEIDEMLRIKLCEAGSNKEIFTFIAWIGAFNINEPIYLELCHVFYSTYEFDEVCADDELQTKKIIKFRLGGRAHNLTLLEFARRLGLYHADEINEEGFNVYFQGGWCINDHLWYANVAWLIARWMKRKGADLDTTTLREMIDFKGRLILEDPQSSVSRVANSRPPRASMKDLYERIGNIEIRQGEIESMSYRERITYLDMLNHSMIIIISTTHLSHRCSSSKMMMSSVEMTQENGQKKGARWK
nr:hypothetical protein [Tanacetum cinerariifolium]